MRNPSNRGAYRLAAIGLAVLALGLFGVTLPGAAQVQTDTAMTGAVSDSSGAVIHGAVVSLKNENTGEVRSTPTNSSGAYSFLSIPPGTYTLRVALPGFKTAEITHRVAQVGQPAQADFLLEVGESAQTVTVS